jgi:hypothetical protein
MSDSDGGSSSSGGYSDSLSEFLLSSNSFQETVFDLRDEFPNFVPSISRLSQVQSRIRDQIATLNQSSSRATAPVVVQSTFESQRAIPDTMPPTSNVLGEPRKPVITLASALPTTSYNEQNETTGSVRTIAYVKVQCALLKYLETRASDSLTAQQARQWTQAIDPTGHRRPKAADALKLCYYMRSQGYNVYATIQNKEILLCIVTLQGFHALYWAQSITTNMVRDIEDQTPYRPRRNAVPNVEVSGGSLEAPFEPQAAEDDGLIAAEAHVEAMLEDEDADPE